MSHRIVTISLVSIIIAASLRVCETTADPVEIPIFPGAEGFGTDTPGGRGGRVIRVTTLADGGPGSLREAINVQEPRTIIFEVGGTVGLQSDLDIFNPFLTIAGQTAPSPGLTVAGKTVRVSTHDVLIQHLRFRGADGNGIAISGLPDGSVEVYNVVVDHCSISWAVNKNLLTWFPNVHDVTIRNCIISESLPYPDSGNRMGFLIGDHTQNIAAIGNLFAHNSKRNPAPYGDTSSIVLNNVIYNPGPGAIHLQDYNESGPLKSSVVGNVIIPGFDTPNWWCTPRECQPIHISSSTAQRTRIYLGDNEAPGRTDDPWALAKVAVSFDVKAIEPPIWDGGLAVRPSSQVVDWVLTEAGARPWDRDSVDERIVSNVRNGTGRLVDSIEDAGGWPDLQPARHTLYPPENPNDDDDEDGYTNLEEWIFEFGQPPPSDKRFVTFLPLVLR
jgi:hypothetical protein